MTTINAICRLVGGRLQAVDHLNQEELNRIRPGADVTVKITVPNSAEENHRLKVLRKMWKLADLVAKNYAVELHDKDAAMDFLCIRCFHVQQIKIPITGHIVTRRRSLSESGLNLDGLLDRMVTLTCTELLEGLQESALRKELEEIVTDKRYEGWRR